MAEYQWLLGDAEKRVYVEDFSVGSAEAPESASAWHIRKRTLRGGLSDGVDIVEVDNGVFRFTVVPTRGMGIWRGWLGEREIGWQSPVRGPVHPRYVPLYTPDGCGWLEGFDELLVRCGLASNGAPDFDDAGKLVHPLHGRIANIPAHRLEIRFNSKSEVIKVIGEIDECRFHGHQLRLTTTVATTLRQPGLTIHDTVLNYSTRPQTMQMLYHMNIGAPALEPGSKLIAPVKTVTPLTDEAAEGVELWAAYQAGTAGAEEEVFLLELLPDVRGQTNVLLENAGADFGVGVAFDMHQLPYFTQWKHAVPAAEGYVTGLEPGTNYPNSYSYERRQGRVVTLGGGELAEFDVTLSLYDGADEVTQAKREISHLQGSVQTSVHSRPQPGWSSRA